MQIQLFGHYHSRIIRIFLSKIGKRYGCIGGNMYSIYLLNCCYCHHQIHENTVCRENTVINIKKSTSLERILIKEKFVFNHQFFIDSAFGTCVNKAVVLA